MNEISDFKYIIYTEDPPTKDGVVSTGLSRVNSNIIKCLSKALGGLIIIDFKLRKFFKKENLIEIEHVPTTLVNTSNIVWLTYLIKKKIRIINDNLPLSIMRKIKIKHKIKAQCRLFVPIGIEYRTLFRAASIAKYLNIPVDCYLVDDILSANELNGTPLSSDEKIKFHQTLRNCERVFAITDGLKKLIFEEFDINSARLSLPYDISSKLNLIHMKIKRQNQTM